MWKVRPVLLDSCRPLGGRSGVPSLSLRVDVLTPFGDPGGDCARLVEMGFRKPTDLNSADAIGVWSTSD